MSILEHNLPSYDLEKIKSTFKTIRSLNMTVSAMQGMYNLGFDFQDVVDVIQSLTIFDFYKSMQPKISKFTALQDVYKPIFKGIELYIKFQVDKRGEMIVSFKEK